MRAARPYLLVIVVAAVAACSGSGSSSACGDFDDLLVTSRVGDDPGEMRVVLLHPDGELGEVVTGEDLVAAGPSFSPDGELVVFERYVGDFESSGPEASSLAIIGTDGTGLEQLTGPKAGTAVEDERSTQELGTFDLEPDWSPTDDVVVYTHRAAKRSELFVVEPSGEPRRLVEAPADGSDSAPAWSPDGRRVAFLRATPAGVALLIAEVDGGTVRSVAALPGVNAHRTERLTWAPDGTTVFVSTSVPQNQPALPVLVDLGTGQVDAEPTTSVDPAWSGDDRLYSFTRHEGDRVESGSARWRLTVVHFADGEMQEVAHVGAGSPGLITRGLDVHRCD